MRSVSYLLLPETAIGQPLWPTWELCEAVLELVEPLAFPNHCMVKLPAGALFRGVCSPPGKVVAPVAFPKAPTGLGEFCPTLEAPCVPVSELVEMLVVPEAFRKGRPVGIWPCVDAVPLVIAEPCETAPVLTRLIIDEPRVDTGDPDMTLARPDEDPPGRFSVAEPARGVALVELARFPKGSAIVPSPPPWVVEVSAHVGPEFPAPCEEIIAIGPGAANPPESNLLSSRDSQRNAAFDLGRERFV
jgi:hypothetical protein